jgi:hypothetical protein
LRGLWSQLQAWGNAPGNKQEVLTLHCCALVALDDVLHLHCVLLFQLLNKQQGLYGIAYSPITSRVGVLLQWVVVLAIHG